MYCPDCGKPSPEVDTFCANCGATLRATPREAVRPAQSFSVWPLHDSLAVWDYPDNDAPKRLLFKVNRGVELRVLSRQDDRYVVALPDHTSGQVLASSVDVAPPGIVIEPSIDRVTGYLLPAAPTAATFGRRVGGYLTDQAFNFAGLVALDIVLYLTLLPDKYTQQDLDAVRGTVTLISFATVFAYKWIADSLGGTLGKLIFGLRVVDELTLEAPGFWVGLTRTIVSIGSGLALGLGYLWAAWDDEGKTWHDHVASTIVVKSRGRRKRPAGREQS